MSTPDWKDVLPVPPPGARLHEAWMTSFDRPDAALLVEHLLPSLLGASHGPAQEPRERTLFFGELCTALQALRGRLTVISSPAHDSPAASPYPWLWRYLSHFTVGARSRAVQHAKLWAFHWKREGEELLELHVSSTNLTASAFKGQVQAGWQALLPIVPRASEGTRQRWGELVPFLRALAASSGDTAATPIRRLVALLGRVACPANAIFVASVPGTRGAARQLAQFDPVELHVLAPTVGDWTDRSLSDWRADVGVDGGKVNLAWIAKTHPWAASSGWSLTQGALDVLTARGVRLQRLPDDARFAAQHRDGDKRWSHAKLYLMRSRHKKKRRLLITSANWSPSAWGAGRRAPRNFELGVVIETDWTGLETMGQPFDRDSAPFCCEAERSLPEESSLQWAQASWDGKRIELLARSRDSSTTIEATVTFSGAPAKRVALAGGAGTVPWRAAARTPLAARFTQGAEALEVDVIDLRPHADFAGTPLPEVDPAAAPALRAGFLLQRYGGTAVDGGAIPGSRGTGQPSGVAGPPADYAVQAWLDARAAFGVLDNWRRAVDDARSDQAVLQQLLADGQQLRAVYARQGGVAADLVAEEFGWRIDKEA